MSKYAHAGYIAAIVVLLAGMIVALVSWKQAAVDQAVASAKSEANQKTLQQNQADIDQRRRDQELQDKRLDDLIGQLKTVGQARQALQPIIVQQPIPAQQITRAELPTAVQQQLPDAPSSTKYSLLTDDQVIALGKNKLACDKLAGNLETCTENTATLEKSVKTAQSDAETWKQQAQGGGTWLRFKRGAKWFAIGVGSGAAVYAVTHH